MRRLAGIIGIFAAAFIAAAAFPEKAEAETQWPEWEMKVEEQMMRAYRLHTAEQNVYNLQSSKVTDVTQSIAEYNTTGYASQITSLDQLKSAFGTAWKKSLAGYRQKTGWTSGSRYHLTPYTGGTGDGALLSSIVAGWKSWDSGAGSEALAKEADRYAASLKDGINSTIADATSGIESGHGYGGTRSYSGSSSQDGDAGKEADEMKKDAVQKASAAVYEKYGITLTENMLDLSGVYVNTSDVTVSRDTQKGDTYSGTKTGQCRNVCLSSDAGMSRAEALKSSSPDGTVYAQLIANIMKTSENASESLVQGKQGNDGAPTYYFTERKNLTSAYIPYIEQQWAASFWDISVCTFNADMQTFLTRAGFTNGSGVNGGVPYEIYQGFAYSLQNLAAAQNFYVLGRSGYYYNPKDWLGFELNKSASAARTAFITDRMKKFFLTDAQIDSFMSSSFVTPAYFQIRFDTDSVQYVSWLTTSCIVRNDLNRYEYWAENLSDENDSDYYGKPAQITLSDKKDPNLTADELTLDGKDHWGTLLFTRYKYVDYTYYMYYAYMGKGGTGMQGTDMYPAYLEKYKGTEPPAVVLGYQKNSGEPQYPWLWEHAWSTTDAGDPWVSDSDIEKAVGVVQEHLAADSPETGSGNKVGIVWGGDPEYTSPWKSGHPLRTLDGHAGYGDYYMYSEPVRAEVTYFITMIPNGIGNTYGLCLGDKPSCEDSPGCADEKTLCECTDESGDGSCEQSQKDYIISSTLTN